MQIQVGLVWGNSNVWVFHSLFGRTSYTLLQFQCGFGFGVKKGCNTGVSHSNIFEKGGPWTIQKIIGLLQLPHDLTHMITHIWWFSPQKWGFHYLSLTNWASQTKTIKPEESTNKHMWFSWPKFGCNRPKWWWNQQRRSMTEIDGDSAYKLRILIHKRGKLSELWISLMRNHINCGRYQVENPQNTKLTGAPRESDWWFTSIPTKQTSYPLVI